MRSPPAPAAFWNKAYYCIGYCSIQDGAPWPAFCVAFVMAWGPGASAAVCAWMGEYSIENAEACGSFRSKKRRVF